MSQTAQKPRAADNGLYCPLWRKACCKVCHTCPWWQLVRGRNPQTGADLDDWGCAIAHMPLLTIATVQAQRQTIATVDAMRNEVQRGNDGAVLTTLAQLNHAVGVGSAVNKADAYISGDPVSAPKLLGADDAVR